jgi:asparagine synthase (glutamine-hydrolysing)
MCGICGLARVHDSHWEPDRDVLASMSAALANRGPDSRGMMVAGPVGLAARRLSIIDLEHGDQPVTGQSNRVHAIQNGEIVNYRELRDELAAAGHSFDSRGDTEVIPHLYERHGLDFARRLRGMFAIAIWDEERGRLVLARDRFGIKPLAYSFTHDELAFASELGSLRHAPLVSGEVDPEALAAFLAFNSVPAPLTILSGVRKLPPGHLLIWDRGSRPRLERFARPAPPPARELRRDADDALAAELLERLRASVEAHLVADVPVGVFLSGGVDSGTLTALAAQATADRLKTFSIGFSERSFDELGRARAVARRYGTDHAELVIEPDAVEWLPRIVAAFDEPFGDSSALPTYLVSELAARSVKLVLSGEGSDELFGGYYTYLADRLAPGLRLPARAMRPLVDRLPSSSRKVSLDYMAKRFVRGVDRPALERHHAWKEIFSPGLSELLLSRRFGDWDPIEPLRRRYAETEGAEPLARLQDVDLGTYLVDDLLVKTDRASMAHSLEARVPFLDAAVAEFALSLPRRARLRGLQKKWLLRRAVRPLLPAAVVDGRKHGFSAPIAAWLRGEMRDFMRETLAPSVLERQGYLDPTQVARLIDRHLSGAEDLSRQLWGLLSLTLWHEQHQAAAAPAAA